MFQIPPLCRLNTKCAHHAFQIYVYNSIAEITLFEPKMHGQFNGRHHAFQIDDVQFNRRHHAFQIHDARYNCGYQEFQIHDARFHRGHQAFQILDARFNHGHHSFQIHDSIVGTMRFKSMICMIQLQAHHVI